MLVKVGTRTGLVPSMIEDPILIPARAWMMSVYVSRSTYSRASFGKWGTNIDDFD